MITVWLLLLLLVVNGAPILAHRLLKHRYAAPVDGGRLWHDGRPLLGKSKTWRGLITGTLACALVSWLLDLGALFGALFGVVALLGDLVSSFIKRRLGLIPSARATGLDQIPESLLPVLFAAMWLNLGTVAVILTPTLFTAINIIFSPQLYRLGIRSKPH